MAGLAKPLPRDRLPLKPFIAAGSGASTGGLLAVLSASGWLHSTRSETGEDGVSSKAAGCNCQSTTLPPCVPATNWPPARQLLSEQAIKATQGWLVKEQIVLSERPTGQPSYAGHAVSGRDVLRSCAWLTDLPCPEQCRIEEQNFAIAPSGGLQPVGAKHTLACGS